VKKKLARYGYIRNGSLLPFIKFITKKINIISSSFNQPISELSGGNQQKTLFARWLILDILLFMLVAFLTQATMAQDV
jgi:ribose transport system ATP-binding protein